jgi:hypothetical protein
VRAQLVMPAAAATPPGAAPAGPLQPAGSGALQMAPFGGL